MKRILFVVSRNQLELLPRLEQECRGGSVEIIVDRRIADRRIGDRRKRSEAQSPADRRRSDRRVHPNSSDLDLIGIAVVVLS